VVSRQCEVLGVPVGAAKAKTGKAVVAKTMAAIVNLRENMGDSSW
jgi:hypothetical protein